MKRSIARRWAAALESGEYKQARQQLRKGDAMCCLGVLCNLHAQDNPEFAKKQKIKKYYGYEIALPPSEVVTWAGMSSDDPYISEQGCTIADLNDTEKLKFPEIAKLIRKHWKEL